MLLFALVLCHQIVTNAVINQSNKIDFAELNHIRYGLLSVDSWKDQISEIVIEEIDQLDLTTSNQKELKSALEKQLSVLIDKINTRIKDNNKGTLKGWAKQRVLNSLVKVEVIKKGIPGYADAMMLEMKKPKMKGKLKNLLKEKIIEYMEQSYDTQDMSQINRIIKKTESENIDEARIKLTIEISRRFRVTSDLSMLLIILAVVMFVIPFVWKKAVSPFQFSSMIIMLLILLVAGVTTPMIDLEARISEMSFILMNNPIKFENQVLFFQTKSILDVFWIMITHDDLKMKFVGLLLILFSILFPLCKLLSSLIYYYSPVSRKKKSIQFFVLKSGKWSMADVLVIAIFMAYIGFNGVITSQLGHLKNANPDIVVLTTNGTSLQPGYYLFFTFALLSLFLSSFLKMRKN